MKKTLLTILASILIAGLFAQEIPQKISYQGKLYENNSPVNGTKSITFTIGTWNETHFNVSIENGLYSVQLGDITPIPSNIFSNSSASLQIAVEGNNLSPNTDILSVPFAYKAEKAVTAENVPTKLSQLTNDKGFITSANDADASSTNEIQTISKSGNTISLSKNGGSISVGDADSDASNELQKLTKSGSNITLSNNGGSVSINDDDANASNEIQTLTKSGNTLSLSNGGGSVDISGGGLSLPINEDTNHGEDDIDIDHQSAGGNVLDLRITNSSNSNEVIEARTDGSGDAIYARTNGSGDAIAALATGNGDAIHAIVSGSGNAIYAKTTGNDEAAYVFIDNSNSDEDALYVKTNGTGRAAYFSGDVKVSGSLSKSSGSFIIDHPIDPENNYMYHSFVESPDMMNIYNGNVVLNENGTAKIEMPNWFEALNMEFRYQLTCIGSFAQVYISKKIENNTFEIAGGKAGLEVSWQVTGVRNDPYARENRIQVEVEKTGEEKGRYLHYKEYNQPIEKSIDALKDSELSK